jgi:voltage-gated potassium channel
VTPEARAARVSLGYQLAMLVLCLYALGVLAAQTVLRLDPRTRAIFDQADYVVCVLFMADFVVSLARAPNRWRYFTTWGWIDLLSSIQTISPARWGRAARVLRVLRVLRGLRATKILTTLVLKRRAENTVLAASLIVLLLVVFCSIAVLHFEDAPESNIKTAGDAIWWALATVTTAGYGDRYPVTAEGRFIATILMCAGVGLFGTLSGFLAAWFLGSEKQPHDPELAAMRQELAAMRELLERMEKVTVADRPAFASVRAEAGGSGVASG